MSDAVGAAGWAAYGATHIGLVRARNEDAFAADEGLGCYLVADGLGGHRGGGVASALARDAVLEVMAGERDALAAGEAAAVLDRALRAANETILERAGGDPSLEGMATTLSVLWLGGDGGGRVAHVGDSRVYRLDPAGLSLLTDDHTLGMEMVRTGAMTLEEAEQSAAWHRLTRAVGLEPDAAVDGFAVETADADAFLVCSDGLTGMVDDGEIVRLLRDRGPEPKAACDALIEGALRNGGYDNVTAVVLYPRRG